MELLEQLVNSFAERNESPLTDDERLIIARDLRSIGVNYASASLLLIAKQYTNAK
jgi:hypothetical protein